MGLQEYNALKKQASKLGVYRRGMKTDELRRAIRQAGASPTASGSSSRGCGCGDKSSRYLSSTYLWDGGMW